VQDGGRKLSTPSFLVFVRSVEPDPSTAALAPARVGVTVTRKVGGAVVRNRIKRLVREAVRRHKMWFPAGREVVMVAKHPAAQLGYADVERELETLCSRYFTRTTRS
jgi:ribonuclease P protein component